MASAAGDSSRGLNPSWTELADDLSKLTVDEQAVIRRVMAKDAILTRGPPIIAPASAMALASSMQELDRLHNREIHQIQEVMKRDVQFQTDLKVR